MTNAIRKLLLACYYGYSFSLAIRVHEGMCVVKSPDSSDYISEIIKLPISLISIQFPFR